MRTSFQTISIFNNRFNPFINCYQISNILNVWQTERTNPTTANYGSQLTITSSPTDSLSSTSTTGTALSLKSSVDSMRFSQELALCDRLSELRQGLTCGQVIATTANSSAFNNITNTTNSTAVAAVAASLLPQSVSHSYTAAALLSSHAYYANSSTTPYMNGPPVMPPSLLYPQLYPSQLGPTGAPTLGQTSTAQSSIHLLSNASEVSRNETNTDSNDECSISTDTEQNNESNSDSDRARSRTNNVSVGNGQHRHHRQQQLTTSRSSIFERTVHSSAHHSSQPLRQLQNGISGSATSANTNTTNATNTTTETLWRPYWLQIDCNSLFTTTTQ